MVLSFQVISFFSSRLLQAGAELSVERVLEIIKQGVVALPKDRLKVSCLQSSLLTLAAEHLMHIAASSRLYSESYRLPSAHKFRETKYLLCSALILKLKFRREQADIPSHH